MIPKEIKRDAAGLTRLGRIHEADKLVAKARLMAAACLADLDRGFAEFADDDCTECGTNRECGLHVYDDTLVDAADFFQAAGLSLLAKRVRKIPQTCVALAWEEFDRANVRTEI